MRGGPAIVPRSARIRAIFEGVVTDIVDHRAEPRVYLLKSDGAPFAWPPNEPVLPADARSFLTGYLARESARKDPAVHVSHDEAGSTVVRVFPRHTPHERWYAVLVERYAAREPGPARAV
ncbi:MAG: hypothetical protein ABI186_06350 [Candidatus Elarobacter sp.]